MEDKQQVPPIAVGVAPVVGRIVTKARRYTTRDGDVQYATVLALPAVDEFSGAQRIEVRSAERLGEVGDLWRGRVRLGGVSRSFTYRDKETGESKSGLDTTVVLTVL